MSVEGSHREQPQGSCSGVGGEHADATHADRQAGRKADRQAGRQEGTSQPVGLCGHLAMI